MGRRSVCQSRLPTRGTLVYDGLLCGAVLSERAMGDIRGDTARWAGLLEVPFSGVALVG